MRCFLSLMLLLLSFSSLTANAEIVTGNPNASVILVEYFDYLCPHCCNNLKVINDYLAAHHNIKIIYKLVPAFGDTSWQSDSLILAAIYQHRFPQLHHLLVQQPFLQNAADVVALAQQLHLNIAQLQQDTLRPAIKQELTNNSNELAAWRSNTVPLTIIETTKLKQFIVVQGELSNAQLATLLDAATNIKEDKKSRAEILETKTPSGKQF